VPARSQSLVAILERPEEGGNKLTTRFVVFGRIAAAAAVLAGCPYPAGNDPNVPDLEPDGTVNPLASAAACPPAAPSACSQTPSYAKAIAPLIERACVPCHSATGDAADRPLATYSDVELLETTSFVQINGCVMPPAEAGADAALTLQERTEILEWFVCGSPDN
jgi:hypothetical protein